MGTRMVHLLLGCAIALIGSFPGLCVGAQAPTPIASAAAVRAVTTLGLNSRERHALSSFYCEHKGFEWPDGQLAELRSILSHAADQGLDPARYHVDALLGSDPTERNFSATAMALRYAHDMVRGEVNLSTLSRDVDVPRPRLALGSQMALAVSEHRIAAWLTGLRPKDPQYARLLRVLARYRAAMAGEEESAPIPPGRTLRSGDDDSRVPLVKARLRAAGDLVSGDTSPIFDAVTSRAVESFQRRHGLAVDGRVGRRTIAALNVPVSGRLAQIRANLERRRYFGHVLTPTRIEVNVAAATVTLFRDWHPVLTMRAVVGDRHHHSPIFISPSLWSIVLNPPWVVPRSIVEQEILPMLAQDPGYLAENDMHWIGGQLVQSPGPDNSLGVIKFEFPNRFSVYLHDTPARALFRLQDRARSHGCVRLERPQELTLALLKHDRDWSPSRIARELASGSTVRIALTSGPPVVFAYWTVFVDDDGTVEFRDDIYHWDARLFPFLKHRVASASPRIPPIKLHCAARLE